MVVPGMMDASHSTILNYRSSMSWHEGYIKYLSLAKGFGFIAEPGKRTEVFFHRGALRPPLDWDVTLSQRRVRFAISQSPKGPKAVSVMAAD